MIHSLIVNAVMDNHAISRIIDSDGSSWDVMYANIFLRMRLGKEDLTPYEGSNLWASNDSITPPCDIKELQVSFREG